MMRGKNSDGFCETFSHPPSKPSSSIKINMSTAAISIAERVKENPRTGFRGYGPLNPLFEQKLPHPVPKSWQGKGSVWRERWGYMFTPFSDDSPEMSFDFGATYEEMLLAGDDVVVDVVNSSSSDSMEPTIPWGNSTSEEEMDVEGSRYGLQSPRPLDYSCSMSETF
jgi:hypothetical protein